MRKRTNKEIETFILETFKGERWGSAENVEIIRFGSAIGIEVIDIEVTKMYDWETMPCGEEELDKVAEFFETENVDKYDDISRGGCETCDYGSAYGFVIRVWE